MRRRLPALLAAVLVAGCLARAARPALPAGSVDLFGVALGDERDHRTLQGIAGTDEPCLRGYERSFDDLEVVLSYGRDGRVRRLSTSNPRTSLFGVAPGTALTQARVRLLGSGFAPGASPLELRGFGATLRLREGPPGRVQGLSLELDD